MTWTDLILSHYAVSSPTVRFLRHSDNLTFLVTDSVKNNRYLLRMHKPLTPNFEDIRQKPQAIYSELFWMDVLKREADIPVQPVIRNKKGELVTSVILPQTGQEVQCSLLGWLEAEEFHPDVANIEDLAQQLGRLVARMHNHSCRWQPPKNFLRPKYGPDHVQQIIKKLSPGVDAGIIHPEDYSTVKITAEKVEEIVSSIEQVPDNWGMVHNDLHTGNWLYQGEIIYPIDFSLCGFNYHLFDIATCAGSIGAEKPHLRRLFTKGYLEVRFLPRDYIKKIEAFFATSVLSYYAFILPDPEQNEWISNRFPKMVESVCRRFLRGESIFFGDEQY